MPAPALGITARSTIDRIIDGDTIEAHVLGVRMHLRLRRCWAPEITGAEKLKGEKAKAALEKLAPPGCDAIVHISTEEARSIGDVFTFGRVLADVWAKGDDESLSEQMVAMGMATESRP